MQRSLIVVAKQPTPGHAKTRLCPPLTAEQAAHLYTCFLHDTLAIMRQVPGVSRTIAYLPETAGGYFRALAPDMHTMVQRGNSLGERLDHALQDALDAGAQQVVIMDSDSPTLPPSSVALAFTMLEGCADVVLGPCEDGGYYLIGLKQPQPRLLREVVMSTPVVVRDTLRLADEMGLRSALLPPWYDVDTAADLDRLRADLALLPAERAPHTRALLAAWGKQAPVQPNT